MATIQGSFPKTRHAGADPEAVIKALIEMRRRL